MRTALVIRLIIVLGFAIFVGIQQMWFLLAFAIVVAAVTAWQITKT